MIISSICRRHLDTCSMALLMERFCTSVGFLPRSTPVVGLMVLVLRCSSSADLSKVVPSWARIGSTNTFCTGTEVTFGDAPAVRAVD